MATARWHLRFENFRSALARLNDAMSIDAISDLERAGAIHRFEGAWEQAWKAMRDYMWATGVKIDVANPANVIRAAFQIDLIDDGDLWIGGMQDRNRTSHEYDEGVAERVFVEIRNRYLASLVALEAKLLREVERGN